MKLLTQGSILLGIWLLGELVSRLLQNWLTIPGAIAGMLLLLIGLSSGLIKESAIKDIGDWLLGNIAFFFVPVSVSVMAINGLSAKYIAPLLIIGLLSTVATMVVTMLTTHYLTVFKNRKGGNHDD